MSRDPSDYIVPAAFGVAGLVFAFFVSGAVHASRAGQTPDFRPDAVISGEYFGSNPPKDHAALQAKVIQEAAKRTGAPVPSFARADADRSDPTVRKMLRIEMLALDNAYGWSDKYDR